MGDRGNIVINDGPHPTYLYTHWTGSSLHIPLHAALKRVPGRWNDGPYLARAIFCEMVKGREMEETGYGISTYPSDNSHPFLVVNVSSQTITRGNDVPDPMYPPAQTWTFREFANADPASLEEPNEEDE